VVGGGFAGEDGELCLRWWDKFNLQEHIGNLTCGTIVLA
jgi:hypothetical protein